LSGLKIESLVLAAWFSFQGKVVNLPTLHRAPMPDRECREKRSHGKSQLLIT
jgi:hypothetical protein